MRPSVNLLPESYRLSRRHDRRIRRGIAIGATILAVELVGGLTLHARAGRTRSALDDVESARMALQLIKSELDEPTLMAAQIGQEIKLAKELRTKHRWSRLLTLLSEAITERVVLTTIATVPRQWTRAQAARQLGATRHWARGKDSQSEDGEEFPNAVVTLSGITLHGYAADYQDLSKFIRRLDELRAFASVNREEARRDKYLGQEAIAFELECHW